MIEIVLFHVITAQAWQEKASGRFIGPLSDDHISKLIASVGSGRMDRTTVAGPPSFTQRLYSRLPNLGVPENTLTAL